MRIFFRDYLEDITKLIHKIKINLYGVIGIRSNDTHT